MQLSSIEKQNVYDLCIFFSGFLPLCVHWFERVDVHLFLLYLCVWNLKIKIDPNKLFCLTTKFQIKMSAIIGIGYNKNVVKQYYFFHSFVHSFLLVVVSSCCGCCCFVFECNVVDLSLYWISLSHALCSF